MAGAARCEDRELELAQNSHPGSSPPTVVDVDRASNARLCGESSEERPLHCLSVPGGVGYTFAHRRQL